MTEMAKEWIQGADQIIILSIAHFQNADLQDVNLCK